jgi:ubiquinone/menaquinone biosynthesis C-methylase UbiE
LNKPEFDQFAHNYEVVTSQNTSFFDADAHYFGSYRSSIVKKFARSRADNILDFGCGVGLGVSPLREMFPNSQIVGCDPSQESLALARAREPDCEFLESSAISQGPRFDIITAVCVFHHIVPSDRPGALRYCYERLKPGGKLFIFEHNPYNPVTRHLVSRCPVDRDAILLTPNETVKRMQQAGFALTAAEYCLFFPKVLAFLRPIEPYLGWLPLGGQYFAIGSRG